MTTRKLALLRGKPFFAGITWDRKLKGFVLGWGAGTGVENILYIKLMTISPFRWPPVRVFESFMEKEGN